MRLLLCLVFIPATVIHISSLRLNKRAIFPQGNPTRMQIIAGFGLPVDLKFESLTMGYVLKAQYFLPYNSSQLYRKEVIGTPIRIQRDNSMSEQKTLFGIDQSYIGTPFGEQKNPYNNELSRWILYKSLESLMELNGLNGRQCILRGICEVAEKPFFYGSGLLGELFQIILTPSNTNDKLSHHSDYEYFHAEQSGRGGDPCDRVYNECSTSPLEIFSKSFLIFQSFEFSSLLRYEQLRNTLLTGEPLNG